MSRREIKLSKECLVCGKTTTNKFCSRECYHIHQRQNIYPGRYVKGHQGLVGENNPIWKGNEAGYTAIHEWVYRNLGKPSMCEECGTTEAKKYEWANISKQYKRETSDWKRLCVSCHRMYDGHGYKLWETRRRSNA